MRRMNGMDAFWIHNDNLNTVQHTLKIAILDPSTASGGWSIDQHRAALRSLPKVLPFTRWKYLKVPLGLHHPVWVEDPGFDIDYHIRHVACPAPGDNRALCDLIAQLYISPLDHRRPLWIVWVIEGLQGGKIANVMLLHHAYADGSGASLMMQRCFKPKPFTFALGYTAPQSPPLPGKLNLLFRALADLPATFIRSVPIVVRGVLTMRKMKKRRIAEGRELAPSLFKDGRDSPVNDMVSACRSFVFETFDLARIKRISKKYQVTINDLFVACAAGMYRRFLIDKGYDPDSGPLLTAIPVSRRLPSATDDGLGNKMTTDVLAMPVHLADPMARLVAARHAGNVMKEHYREAEGADMGSVLELLPEFAIKLLNRSIARTRGKSGIGGNAMLSNVPGPRETLYLGETRLENWVSSGQVTHGMAINVTAWSYAENFNLCVLADKKLLPDGWLFIRYFSEALDEYDRLAGQTSGSSPPPLHVA